MLFVHALCRLLVVIVISSEHSCYKHHYRLLIQYPMRPSRYAFEAVVFCQPYTFYLLLLLTLTLYLLLTCSLSPSLPYILLLSHVLSQCPQGNGTTLAPSELRLGKMHLVDLAGSERVALSGAEGDTLLETQSINLSLTAIGE